SQRLALAMGFTFLDRILGDMRAALDGPQVPTPGLDQIFFGGERAMDDEGYLLSSNGKFLFVLLMPQKDYATLEVIAAPLVLARDALREARTAFPDIRAGLTGRPVLQADEMTVTSRDMTRGTLLALAVVAALLIGYFRRPTRPLLAVGALAMGIAWTYGLAAVTIGYLNILSIVFSVVLVGAGIEYGLQLVARYTEEIAAHGDVARAITTCITQTGRGNLSACATTAAAFFAALATPFLALRELGFIAGTGIVLCLAAMLTVLPALMYLADRRRAPAVLRAHRPLRLGFLARMYAHPRLVLLGLGLLTLAALPGLRRLRFDHNLLTLQAKGLESVAYELKLIHETDQSTWHTPFIAPSREEAILLAERVKQLPTVERALTVTEIVPAEQETKIGIINKIAPAFAGIRFAEPAAGIAPQALDAALAEFLGHVDRLTSLAFQGGEAEAVAALEEIRAETLGLREAIAAASPSAAARLVEYQRIFFRDFQRKLGLLAEGMQPSSVRLEDLPPTLRSRYVSAAGRTVVYAYPKANLWEPAAMAAYIRDIRSIDPHVTGVPVEVYESSRLFERSFRLVAVIAFVAILAIALLDFRNWRHALLAVTPLCAGLLWLLEWMGWTGLPFNMANFFAIPILIGVGVDNGIQLVHRCRQDGGFHPALITQSTGTAVALTSATTFASFVMLCLAAHRGIWSLGALMSLGTIACLIGSLVLLPCLLRMGMGRDEKSEIRNTFEIRIPKFKAF
ncbi:MAG: MMPL family transporter, partial [Deltaproteobacteria bacterium]|nr:MMPL family transporter [Deltaproteobacteria bacterium]